jgi:hypothetical protein
MRLPRHFVPRNDGFRFLLPSDKGRRNNKKRIERWDPHAGKHRSGWHIIMIPSPLMGEGEDEGENPWFDMPWHVATLNGWKKCRGGEKNKKLERVRMRVKFLRFTVHGSLFTFFGIDIDI